MKIAFTGHRNARTTEKALEAVAREFPGAVWCHGGAQGFDSQVDAWARARGIPVQVIRPDYRGKGRAAPLIRNREIVAGSAALFACYDGRKGGGTDYTVRHGLHSGVPVHFLTCIVGEEITPGGWPT